MNLYDALKYLTSFDLNDLKNLDLLLYCPFQTGRFTITSKLGVIGIVCQTNRTNREQLLPQPQERQAFLDNFQQTLDKFNVPQAEREELDAIVTSTRESIATPPLQEDTGESKA